MQIRRDLYGITKGLLFFFKYLFGGHLKIYERGGGVVVLPASFLKNKAALAFHEEMRLLSGKRSVYSARLKTKGIGVISCDSLTLWRLSALKVSFLMLAASIAALVAESSPRLPRPAFCRRINTSFSQSNKNGLWKAGNKKTRNQYLATNSLKNFNTDSF